MKSAVSVVIEHDAINFHTCVTLWEMSMHIIHRTKRPENLLCQLCIKFAITNIQRVCYINVSYTLQEQI